MQNPQHEIGIVCGQCDTWCALGTKLCPECTNELDLVGPRRSSIPPPARPAASPATAPMGPLVPGKPPAVPVPTAVEIKPQAAKPVPARSGAYSFPARSEFADLSQEELMEQARNYVCRSCSSGVPSGHKFCGRCGTAVPLGMAQCGI